MEKIISISIQENQFKYTYDGINSSFLMQDNIIPIDLISKINANLVENKQTYISLLHNITSEKINLDNDIGYKTVQLNYNNTISMQTGIYQNLLERYSSLNCDTIFSPYHILIEHIQEENLYLQLNLLLLDNKLYVLITDENYKITYYNTQVLTTIKEIEQSKFFIDSIGEQQLFQEIHQLEIEQFIKQSIDEYSLLQNSISIDNINLFYSLKTVSTKAEYHKITIANSIEKLTQDELINSNKSYKKIKNKKSTNILSKLFIVFVAGLIVYSFLQFNTKNTTTVNSTKQDITFDTFSHIEINNNIKSSLKQILDTITYDAIIDKITIDRDKSTIIVTSLYSDTYIKNLKPNIQNIYENSKLSSQVIQGNIYKSTINNIYLIDNKHATKPSLKSYSKQSKTAKQIEEKLLSLMPQASLIQLSNKDNDIYTFSIDTQLQNPKQLYSLIDNISDQNSAINIQYPIIITNKQSYLQIKFNLAYQQ